MPACVPRTYDESMRLYHAELTRLADQAFHMYFQNPAQWLYLFGTMQAGNFAKGYYALTIANEDSEAGEVVIQERIPRHLPVDALRGWFQDKLRREPLWCFCD